MIYDDYDVIVMMVVIVMMSYYVRIRKTMMMMMMYGLLVCIFLCVYRYKYVCVHYQ